MRWAQLRKPLQHDSTKSTAPWARSTWEFGTTELPLTTAPGETRTFSFRVMAVTGCQPSRQPVLAGLGSGPLPDVLVRFRELAVLRGTDRKDCCWNGMPGGRAGDRGGRPRPVIRWSGKVLDGLEWRGRTAQIASGGPGTGTSKAPGRGQLAESGVPGSPLYTAAPDTPSEPGLALLRARGRQLSALASAPPGVRDPANRGASPN